MRNVHRLTIVLGLVAAALTANATVVFEPSVVMFNSREQTVLLNVLDNGAPVAANRIGAMRFLIDGHDYSHMVRAERVNGQIRLRPTGSLEIGTYDLAVTIDGRTYNVPVNARLNLETSSLASRAQAQGLTEMDIRHQLGLYTEGRQSVEINFPAWLYVGKRITLNMPTPADAAFTWHVNGELADSGTGPHEFSFPLTTPAIYRFKYTEHLANGGVIESFTETEAREEPAVPITTSVNQSVRLMGPAGYTDYTWIIDSEFVSEAQTFEHRFPGPGQYRVACIASGNPAIRDEAFRKVLFLVSVE